MVNLSRKIINNAIDYIIRKIDSDITANANSYIAANARNPAKQPRK